jgi:2',3'-cyclic-nucleotide 2'-phosphodiesterase (5'-nucleotidase family)
VSLITKGKQMLACLNKFDIDAACIGNHDFGYFKKLVLK